MPIPTYRIRLANQQKDKQCIEICASSNALFGRKAEVSLKGYFLARRRGAESLTTYWQPI